MIISHRCLSRVDHSSAQGYDYSTNTILLVGGYRNNRAFVTFHNVTFNGHGADYLTQDHGADYLTQEQATYSWSRAQHQHYTQLDDELWIIRDDGEGFITMNTTTYAVDIPSITIPVTVRGDACLSTVPGYLIVVSGWTNTTLHDTQIYSFSDKQWLSSVPLLPNKLRSIHCNVVNDTLYVIGGWEYTWDGSSIYDDIQYLDLGNIDQISTKSWQALSCKLDTARTLCKLLHSLDRFTGDLTGLCNVSSNVEDTEETFFGTNIIDKVLLALGAIIFFCAHNVLNYIYKHLHSKYISPRNKVDDGELSHGDSDVHSMQRIYAPLDVIVQKVENAADPIGDHETMNNMGQDKEADEDVDKEQGMVDVDAMNIMMDLHDVDDVPEVPVGEDCYMKN